MAAVPKGQYVPKGQWVPGSPRANGTRRAIPGIRGHPSLGLYADAERITAVPLEMPERRAQIRMQSIQDAPPWDLMGIPPGIPWDPVLGPQGHNLDQFFLEIYI